MFLSAFTDLIGSILENQAFLIGVISLAATVVMRTGIKIYNMGRLSKAELVTRQEFTKFEAQIRADMRSYRDEIFNNVWKLCETYIKAELKKVDKLPEMASNMEKMAIQFEEKMKNTVEAINEIRPAVQDIHRLERKINRLEYGEAINSKSDRRTDED